MDRKGQGEYCPGRSLNLEVGGHLQGSVAHDEIEFLSSGYTRTKQKEDPAPNLVGHQ